MRKRRTRKYTWFPVRGTGNPGDPNGTDEFNGLFGSLNIAPNGITSAVIVPLIPDVPMEGNEIDPNAPGQLIQSLGQEYFIERIVGKAFIGVSTPVDDAGPPAVTFSKTFLVGVGIFVARAADRNAGGGPDIPIGAASLAEVVENYSPLSTDAIREPWMFRRTWVLHSGRLAGSPNVPQGPFSPHPVGATATIQSQPAPQTNIGYGSALDGPHFDIKSVRKVGNDERLWLVFAARNLDTLIASIEQTTLPTAVTNNAVSGYFDYRVLGRLARARNRSNF